jgi:hypothetical protein
MYLARGATPPWIQNLWLDVLFILFIFWIQNLWLDALFIFRWLSVI